MSGDILDQIDRAIEDYTVSGDAMRWAPDPPTRTSSTNPGRTWIVPRDHLYRPDCYCRACWTRTRARGLDPEAFSPGGFIPARPRTLDLFPHERIICPECGSRTRAYDWVRGRSTHDATCPRLRPAGPRTLADRINAVRDAAWDAAERGNEYIADGLRWVDGIIPLWLVGLLAAVAGAVLGMVR